MASKKNQPKGSSWVVSTFDSFSSSPSADDEKFRKRPREPSGHARSGKKQQYKTQQQQQQQGRPALWVDLYSPSSREELAVHKKKVQEVESWLVESTANMKGRKFLLLTGPSGCGKSTTVRILAREAQLNLVEWTNPTTAPYHNNFMEQDVRWRPDDTVMPVSQTTQFWEFLMRCSKYGNVCGTGYNRNLVCVKDFPNAVLRDPSSFHSMLRRYNQWSNSSPAVFIVSDSTQKFGSVKHLFPHDLQQELSIVNIGFNPIASGLLVKALSRVLSMESTIESSWRYTLPTKEVLHTLADTSGGDVRSAINALQFATRKDMGNIEGLFTGTPKKKSISRTKSQSKITSKSKPRSSEEETQATVGGKDASIFLFRALGKVLYCKRSLDQGITEHLPKHLQAEERLPLQEVPENIYEKTAMGAASFSLFLHQNYLAFFPDVESVAKAVHYLSDSDVLSADWAGQDVLEGYATSLTARGLMHTNKGGSSGGGWRPLTRPQWYAVNKKTQQYSDVLKAEHCSQLLTTEELTTVLVPLKSKILAGLSHTIQEVGQLLNTQKKSSLEHLGELDVSDLTTERDETREAAMAMTFLQQKLLSDPIEDPGQYSEDDLLIEDPDDD